MCTGLGLSAYIGEKSLSNGLREYLQYAGEAHYRFQADLRSKAYLRIEFAPAVASGLS